MNSSRGLKASSVPRVWLFKLEEFSPTHSHNFSQLKFPDIFKHKHWNKDCSPGVNISEVENCNLGLTCNLMNMKVSSTQQHRHCQVGGGAAACRTSEEAEWHLRGEIEWSPGIRVEEETWRDHYRWVEERGVENRILKSYSQPMHSMFLGMFHYPMLSMKENRNKKKSIITNLTLHIIYCAFSWWWVYCVTCRQSYSYCQILCYIQLSGCWLLYSQHRVRKKLSANTFFISATE